MKLITSLPSPRLCKEIPAACWTKLVFVWYLIPRKPGPNPANLLLLIQQEPVVHIELLSRYWSLPPNWDAWGSTIRQLKQDHQRDSETSPWGSFHPYEPLKTADSFPGIDNWSHTSTGRRLDVSGRTIVGLQRVFGGPHQPSPQRRVEP